MKKTKYLALVLVVAIMLVGAGYAAWTQQIVVNSTLTTGNMDVIVGFANLHKPANTGGEISVNKPGPEDTITFSATNLYPTVYNNNDSSTFGKIHFSIENHSTFPIMLESIDFDLVDPTSTAWDYLKTSIHIHKGTVSGRNKTSLGNSASLTGTNPIGSHPVTNPKYLKDLGTLLMTESTLSTTVIQPGEAVWFGNEDPNLASIRYWLDSSAPNDTQNANLGFTLKFNWKQAN